MNKKILISVIIPTFNSERTISRVLQSILSQTFQNFEIIIFDALSKDNTLQKINNYKDERLKLRSEADKGIYEAMNKGIDEANGEWIYFIGSDDYLITNTVLEDLVNQVNLDDYDYVYGNVLSPEYGDKYDGVFDEHKIISQNICHQALFVRKKLFRRLGKFNIRYKLLADYDFNLRCMFDKKVRKKYVDLMIAYYAPAGSSSTRADGLFLKEKDWLLLKYGFSFFSWRERLQLFRQHLKQNYFPKKH
jgi:glycosyltransferase involved in cell wall biosynthesis